MKKVFAICFLGLAFIVPASAKTLPSSVFTGEPSFNGKQNFSDHGVKVSLAIPKKNYEVLYAWFLWDDGCWHLYAGIYTQTIDPITGAGVSGIWWESIDDDNGWVGTHTVCNNSSWNNYC